MSFGAALGMKFIDKGIDQFSYGVSQEYNRYAREKSRKWQLHDLQNSLTYRIEDAKKYGIHPLAAIGATTSPGAPISVGGSTPPYSAGPMPMPSSESKKRYESAMADKAESEAGIKKEELAWVQKHGFNGSQIPSSEWGDGQVDHGAKVSVIPKQQTPRQSKGHEAGANPYWQYVETERGNLKAMISQGVSEPMESDTSSNVEHAIKQGWRKVLDWSHLNNMDRNKVLLGQRPTSPQGYEYRYNRLLGEWILEYKSGRSKLYTKKKHSVKIRR